ncbi:MAG TPA: HAD family hydrolase [Actinomycetota bacterium]|nr:HAD family hydrolase [Actinomycetota bacterium]
MSARAVFFDVGETLVDETRFWTIWARLLNVPPLTLFGVLGGVIERGEDHRRAYDIVAPGVDRAALEPAYAAAGGTQIRPDDFYPDALACLAEVKQRGWLLGISGNTATWVEDALRAADVPADVVASSASWGVEKPSPDFFGRVVASAGLPPDRIAYVGDRLDNDVLPAARAGMTGVFLKRGPWGHLHALRPEAATADLALDSLDELCVRLERRWATGAGGSGRA